MVQVTKELSTIQLSLWLLNPTHFVLRKEESEELRSHWYTVRLKSTGA